MTDAIQLDRCKKLTEILLGWDYDATLYVLACGVRAKLIYEVGVGPAAQSTHALLSALLHTGGKLISCDVVPEWEKSVTDPERLARWEFRCLSSEQFAATLHEQADLIYLDGWHGLDTIHWEVQAFWPLLREDGLMVLHDTLSYPNGPGQVLQMVLARGIEAISLPYTHGIGVIHKRQGDPVELVL